MVSELVHDWCFITTVFLHYFYRTDLTTSTIPAAHEPVTSFTLTTFNRRPSQPRTSSWRQSLVSPPRNHVSVIRQLLWAGHRLASSFRLPVALEPRRAPSTSWPRTSHRRPPSFSAVHHATSVRRPERHLHRTTV